MLVLDGTPIAAHLLADSLNLTNNKIPQPPTDRNASKKADEKKAGKTGQGLTTRKL
jgi:hypothetical protein